MLLVLVRLVYSAVLKSLSFTITTWDVTIGQFRWSHHFYRCCTCNRQKTLEESKFLGEFPWYLLFSHFEPTYHTIIHMEMLSVKLFNHPSEPVVWFSMKRGLRSYHLISEQWIQKGAKEGEEDTRGQVGSWGNLGNFSSFTVILVIWTFREENK